MFERSFLVFLFIFISACSASTQENPESRQPEIAFVPVEGSIESPTPTVLPAIAAMATATLLPSPIPTSISTETPSSNPPPTCPEPGIATPFVYPADTPELQESVLAYLNAGGQWDELLRLLDELKINHDLIQADMNGNGIMETAVYARMLAEENYPPEHAWWIFQCTTDQYDVIYDVRDTWAFHSHFMTDDLNNDNRSEVIAVSGFAGSACDLEPKVWSWQSDKIVDISPSHSELEMGCSIEQRVLFQDLDGDNIKEMILIGETVGHLDYAPPRGITQTFTLEDTGYRLASTVFAPAALRVHVLDDAQRALDAGDIPSAISYYTQAAYEEMGTVESYNLLGDYQADAYQRAFALFRLFVIYQEIGSAEEADSILTELNTLYLENQPGHEFVSLAQTIFDAFEERGDLSEACEQVTSYISEHYENNIEQPRLTHHFYWGMNIAFYTTPESFCPIFTVIGN